MAKKTKKFNLHDKTLNGMELMRSIVCYLTSEYPKAMVESKRERDIYYISLIQNVVVKKATKKKDLQARNVCTFITIHLTDKWCNVDIQGGILSSEKESAGDHLKNAAMGVGVATAALVVPYAALPLLVAGTVGAGIAMHIKEASDSVEKKIMDFIKDFIEQKTTN